MKFFIKAGTAVTMSFLLCSPASAAELNKILTTNKNLSEASAQISGKKISEDTNSNPVNNTSDQPSIPVNPEQATETAPPSTGGNIAEIAKMLPENTPLIGIVSTKISAWSDLNRFQLFKMAEDAIKTFIPAGTNLDYVKDVQSWLGEQAVVAFMPKVGSTPVTLEETSVIIVPIKNMAKVQPFIDLITSNKENTTEREYKGVKITEIKIEVPQLEKPPTKKEPAAKAIKKPLPAKKSRILAIASVPGYVLTGNSSKPIERVIDMREGGIPTLAASPRFQPTLQNPQVNTTLFGIYENIPEFIPLIKDIYDDLLTQIPKTEGIPLPPNPFDDKSFNFEALKEYSSVNGFVTQQPEGLRLQINSYRQQPKSDNGIETTNKTETILSRLPGTTYYSFSGRNLNFVWQTISTAFSTRPELKKGLDEFRKFVKTSVGLDFDKDIMSWMDGEYALFAYPTKGGFIQSFVPNFNLGIGIALQTSNRSSADKAIKKLTEVSQLKVNETDIKGQAVTSLKVGEPSQSLVAYSWMEDNTIILTTGQSAIADLVPKPQSSLTTNYNFITATKSFPRPNQGYFYLNMGSVLSWAYGLIPSQYTQDPNFRIFKQAIGSIYSISATSTADPEREEVDFLIVLAPTRNVNKN
ncbi:DUF3352 domain-containing protein [Calothrix sp. PCC 6303]|uniref:DUF3352 domain-containing protein n=1 Tax=Calothrix sp. PCC 6303 TaxID=1170562 RepID=UPI0002A02E90|nr:DUF3352 domain-containing protein [Calothrix sp. PCC 6303]AFZ01126.1 hypothetical protein Cal6303_2100 [Calothrix sp. PCC 6303]